MFLTAVPLFHLSLPLVVFLHNHVESTRAKHRLLSHLLYSRSAWRTVPEFSYRSCGFPVCFLPTSYQSTSDGTNTVATRTCLRPQHIGPTSEYYERERERLTSGNKIIISINTCCTAINYIRDIPTTIYFTLSSPTPYSQVLRKRQNGILLLREHQLEFKLLLLLLSFVPFHLDKNDEAEVEHLRGINIFAN